MSNLIYSESQKDFWKNRFATRFEDVVQTARVTSLLRSSVSMNQTYQSAIDLGSGNGRFLPLLAAFCQHVWAVEIVPATEGPIAARARNVSPWILQDDADGLPDGPHDFLFAAFLFQHVTEDGVFKGLTNELKRVLAPGARVFILDNAKDKAPHLQVREPGVIAQALGFKKWDSKLVTINQRPADHWWIEGIIG